MKPTHISVWKKAAIAGALAFVLTGAVADARAPESISAREPSEAYLTLVRGDEAREGGDAQSAMAAYEDARARYQRIAEAHPDWESDIVQYRILYCENQIRTLRDQMGLPDEDFEDLDADDEDLDADDMDMGAVSQPEPDEPMVFEEESETLYRDRYLAMLQENEYLRRRVSEVMDEVDEFDIEGAVPADEELEAELALAVQRMTEAEARIRELEEQIQELKKELVSRAVRSEASTPVVAESPYRQEARYQEWMRDALAREKARDVKGALSLYERLVDKYPSDIPSVKGQARCLIAGGHSDKAVRMLVQHAATARDPEVAILLGTAYGAMGRFEDAVAAVEALVRDNPWNARARAVLGAALLGMGDKESARAELEKTLDLDPELPEVLYNLAWVLSDGDDSERGNGREYYRRSLELGGAPDAALEQRLAEP